MTAVLSETLYRTNDIYNIKLRNTTIHNISLSDKCIYRKVTKIY